jgi:hypothetical protein
MHVDAWIQGKFGMNGVYRVRLSQIFIIQAVMPTGSDSR